MPTGNADSSPLVVAGPRPPAVRAGRLPAAVLPLKRRLLLRDLLPPARGIPEAAHGANLIDDSDDVPVLAPDGHGDGRMGSGVGRERHDDDGRAKSVERVRAQDKTGSSLTDLGSLRRIETDPPHITALRDDGVACD